MKRRVTSPHVPEPPAETFSRCLVVGDQVFIAGTTASAQEGIEGGDSMFEQLAELAERDATGEIAVVYEEIRRFYAVPYVSSIQRHLATRPGWLEWVWAALRPAFESGHAQTAAWRAAEAVQAPRLAPISRDALRVWGVDTAGEAGIAAVCAGFIRVSPINMVLAGLLRRLLKGERPGGPGAGATGWMPPASIPALPPMADLATLPPAERAVLASLATAVGDEPFVPGLYRLLARWPGFLAHVATVLPPYFDEAVARAACRRLAESIDAAIPAVFAALPPLPARVPAPPRDEVPGVVAALDAYRKTSPEMVVFGLMIQHALPSPPARGYVPALRARAAPSAPSACAPRPAPGAAGRTRAPGGRG